jgi:AcrR family transcriptional regulator
MMRAAIRQEAADRFFHQGYEATTVRQIADALDIRAASIYYHYPDKQEILFELISSTMDVLTRGVSAAIAEQPDPEGRLAAIVAHHVALHALRPRESTLGETELRSLTGPRLEQVLAMRDGYEQLVRETLAEGSASGAFRLIDPKLTAFAVISMCTNVGIWYRPSGRLALADVARAYVAFAMRLAGAAPIDDARVDGMLASAAAVYQHA